MKHGDTVRWYFEANRYVSGRYIMGTVVEVCDDETVWVEHDKQQIKHNISELVLNDCNPDCYRTEPDNPSLICIGAEKPECEECCLRIHFQIKDIHHLPREEDI